MSEYRSGFQRKFRARQRWKADMKALDYLVTGLVVAFWLVVIFTSTWTGPTP